MKKTIILLASLVGTLVWNTAHAQEEKKTSFGIKLTTNLTNVKVSNMQSGAKFHPGASVGGFARINLNKTFSLQPELLASYTEAKGNTGYERLRFKYVSFEIPVYLQGQINAGTGRVILGVGPHIGYGLSADTRVEQLPQGAPGENKIELDHWYAGEGVTAGYEFRNRIVVNTGYQLGFDFSSRHKSSGGQTHTIYLGVGYRF